MAFERKRRFGSSRGGFGDRGGFGERRGGFGERRSGGFGARRDFGEAPIKEGEEYDVTISEVGSRGDGIARIKNFVVFVANTKKGDSVKIKIKELRERSAVGEVIGAAEAAEATEEAPAEEVVEEVEEAEEETEEEAG